MSDSFSKNPPSKKPSALERSLAKQKAMSEKWVDLGTTILGASYTHANRPVRLNCKVKDIFDNLVVQYVEGIEQINGEYRYTVRCVSAEAGLPSKGWIGAPLEIQIVRDDGELHYLRGLIFDVMEGQSDGGLATYQLTLTSIFDFMALNMRPRVFHALTVTEVIEQVFKEYQAESYEGWMNMRFKMMIDGTVELTKRSNIIQHNESDAAFIQRLCKKHGINWFVRADQGHDAENVFSHEVVFLNHNNFFALTASKTVRYHRMDGTEQKDSINLIAPYRQFTPAAVERQSHDYQTSQIYKSIFKSEQDFMKDQRAAAPPSYVRPSTPSAPSAPMTPQEQARNQALLDKPQFLPLRNYVTDRQVMSPHEGGSPGEFNHLTRLRMRYQDFKAKHFYLEGSVRTLRAGEHFEFNGHHEFDQHPDAEKNLIILEHRFCAQNNLPKEINEKVNRLFKASGWQPLHEFPELPPPEKPKELIIDDHYKSRRTSYHLRYHQKIIASRKTVPVVPSYDPAVDLPKLTINRATVVGGYNPRKPTDEPMQAGREGYVENKPMELNEHGDEIFTDNQGRVRIRLHGFKEAYTWARVATSMAGDQHGGIYIPRIGQEVIIAFDGDDPDKLVIIGVLHNSTHRPPNFSHVGDLPGNRYLSGIKTKENMASRYNQLRFDDTNGEINAQLASEHGHSQLNIGWLNHPRNKGVAEPRGEGAELRTDDALALRSGKGMLLSAWERAQAGDKQLSREEMQGLLKQCFDLLKGLSEYASEHEAFKADIASMESVKQKVHDWENGTNTQKEGASSAGGANLLAITAQDGISITSPQNINTFSTTNIDTVAGNNVQLNAGNQAIINAKQGASLFSHKGGVKVIANQDQLTLQSQHGKTVLNALEDVTVTSTEGNVTIMAKGEIKLITEGGAYIKLKGPDIEVGGLGIFKVKAASHSWQGPNKLPTELPTFTKGEIKGCTLKLSDGAQDSAAGLDR